MAISVILISLDSSEKSVGTSIARVILFGTIPTAIPATVPIVDPPVVHCDTPLIPTETLTNPPVVSTLPHTSLFLYTDSSDSDTSERPPSQDPYEATILPAPSRLPRRPVVLVLLVRKRVRVLPSGRLASRYPPNHSSSNHFLLDDSSSDSSSNSSSDYSSDSSSGHSLPDSSIDTTVTIFVGPSRKRCRSHAVLVSLATPVPRALSPICADLLRPRTRSRGAITAFDFDDSTKDSYEAYTEPDINSDVQENIDVDTAAAKAAAAREANVRVEVSIGSVGEDKAKEEADPKDRGTIEIGVDRVIELVVSDDVYESSSDDMPESVDERGLDALGHRMLAASQQSAVMLGRIRVLERDNMRLRGMLCVKRERVDSLRRHMLNTQEELRQICVMMPTATRTGMTPAAIEEMIERHVAEALEAYEVNQNCRPTMESGDEHEDDNGDGNENGNGVGGGNGNMNGLGGGNGNGNPSMNAGGIVPVARECTYQDFVKCQPLIFKRTKGVVGLTRWFEKMETIFDISSCPQKYQVKYASCTLQNGALTWWNSHKRTVGTDASYTRTWKALMKLMTEVFQELVLLCTKMVLEEEDWVKKFIGGLPDNIQGIVIVAEPMRLQDVVRIANNLIDQKLKGYAARNVEKKRRFDNNSRDNYVKQPPFKRQNGNGHNVARAYTIRNSKKRGYVGPLPYYNKCKLHHEG
ncbi:hypothetical protein Tco_0995781 [Tanacetum coccineum]